MAELQDGQFDAHPNSMQFSTTHWSLVLAAGRRGTVESDSALERLCKSYWPPLYAYDCRRVPDLHEAQDLTQAFFERLLDRDYLAVADPQRGRFRAFLLTAFKHFLSKEWDKAKAQKRGGDRRRISFDFVSQDAMEPADKLTGDAHAQWTHRPCPQRGVQPGRDAAGLGEFGQDSQGVGRDRQSVFGTDSEANTPQEVNR